MSSPQMIDWDVAIATGVRWVRPGPQISMTDARRTVSELRERLELAGLREVDTDLDASGDRYAVVTVTT